ncbi:MAG: 30S ribosomal protein S21 [Gemmatimonadota bacterium]|nr:30S ribosomal protein S21 [Gemmatimonadota bacterium]
MAVEVEIRENEPLQKALRRFRRKVNRAGIMKDLRRRRSYEKPSAERRKKAAAAQRRRLRAARRRRRRAT